MIKYRTQWDVIQAIEVAGETKSLIIMQTGIKERKRSDWRNWHDSWEEAHAFLVSNAEEKIARLQNHVSDAQKELAHIKAMKKDGIK